MRDKVLTELMGECWHERDKMQTFCRKCGVLAKTNTNFSTWSGFGKLLNFCKEQSWWKTSYGAGMCSDDMDSLTFYYIDPDRFADAIYAFIREGGI